MGKTFKKLIGIVTVTIMLFTIALPTFAATNNSKSGYSAPSSITIEVGKSKTFKVTEPSGKYATVSFQYDPGYVSTSGYKAGSYWGESAEITFKGKAPGTFTAYADIEVFSKKGNPNSNYAEYSLPFKIKVINKLKSISMNKKSLSLSVGRSAKLSVAFSPSNTTDSKKLTWSSSNTKVVSVNNGKVTANKAGTAIITAKAINGKTTTCKITVTGKAVPATGISINKTSATLKVGNTTTLTATLKPSNATNRNIIWTSSNTSVVSVKNGKITAQKVGTATITAKTTNGKKATCKITVKEAENYRDVSEAYTLLNTFRTTKSNQWYWNPDNRTKTTTYGLSTVKRDLTLEKIAKVRAKEGWIMYHERGLLTHDRPNGQDCWTAYTCP